MKRLSILRLPAALAACLALGWLAAPAAWAEDVAGGTLNLGGGGGGNQGPSTFDPGGGFDKATDAVSKPLEGAPNTVADNAGFGEGFEQAGKAAEGQGKKLEQIATGSNNGVKKYLGSNPGSKNMPSVKAGLAQQGGFWSKVGSGLKAFGKAIDIVSPIASIAGAYWGGGCTAAKWETANQTGKFGCEKGGAAAGTAVGGPIGTIAGAAAGEAAWEAYGKPKIDAAAQNEIDAETQSTLGGSGPRRPINTNLPNMNCPRPAVSQGTPNVGCTPPPTPPPARPSGGGCGPCR